MENGGVTKAWPDIHFGSAVSPPVDWRKNNADDVDDDEELARTPPDIIAMLGFDPKAVGEKAQDERLALDRASARRVDQDGHLFVERTPISKANICPYYGHEIPNGKELGLDPDKIYKLLRDPNELEKGADSFAGKPLLMIHKPVNAADHPREITIGSVGTDVQFDKPYLTAPLSVWDGEGIYLIDSGEQHELSSSYHYRADMTPGEYEGEPYDGVMRDIRGNHVAIVKEGRAGPDVVVADEALMHIFDFQRLFASDESAEAKARAEGKLSEKTREEIGRAGGAKREDMAEGDFLEPASRKYPVKKDGKYDRNLLLAAAREARMHGHEDLAKRADAIREREFGKAADQKETDMTKVLTRKAEFARGALAAFLAPKLAKDAKIDLGPVLIGVTAKNFKHKRWDITTAIRKQTDGKLAKDASIEALGELLDTLDKTEVPEGADIDPNSGLPVAATTEKKKAGDDDPMAKMKAAMMAKGLTEDEAGEICNMLPSAADESEEEKKKREEEERKAAEAEAAKDKEMQDMPTKAGMDAAIKKAADEATKKAEAATMKRLQDIRAAERGVAPLIGEVTLGLDSAEAIYAAALKANDVDIDGLDLTAMARMVGVLNKHKNAPREPKKVAADESVIATFKKSIGDERSIRNLG